MPTNPLHQKKLFPQWWYHILFADQWQKIKRPGLRKYFELTFRLDNLILKLVMLVITAILVLGLGFGLRNYFLSLNPSPVVINTGIAYSSLANVGAKNPAVVYAVESIPIVISCLAVLLIPNWYASFGFTMMFFGGLTNIIDRSYPKTFWTENPNYPTTKGAYGVQTDHLTHINNGVADYFHGIHSIFNIADVFVIMGVCLGVLGLLIWLIRLNLSEHHPTPPANPNTPC